MPTYTYKCEISNIEFEATHSITDDLQDCPSCKEKGLPSDHKPKRLISKSSFILAGGGWASEGYNKK